MCFRVPSAVIVIVIACVTVVGCSRKATPGPGGVASSLPVAAATSAPPNAPAAPPQAPVQSPLPQSGQAKQVFEAEGITLRELTDGRIELRAKSQWNEPIDQTFQDCNYFRKAFPVLERQLGAERAKLLARVCKAK